MFYLFAPIFGVCEFGERLYGTFEEINAVYNQFAWYSFPYNVQQMLPILIMVAQNPIELRVFGSIACGRITLQNVSKIFIFLPKRKTAQFKIKFRTQSIYGKFLLPFV